MFEAVFVLFLVNLFHLNNNDFEQISEAEYDFEQISEAEKKCKTWFGKPGVFNTFET